MLNFWTTSLRKGSLFILLLIFTLASAVRSQQLPGPAVTNIPTQSAYLELGGLGSFYTLNYDAIWESGWGLRIGGAYLPEETYSSQNSETSYYGTDLLVVLLMGNYAAGKEAHKFESSFGVMLGESNLEDISISVPDPPGLAASLGYRYLPREAGKITFKAAFTPVLADGRIYPKFGISIGFILSE